MNHSSTNFIDLIPMAQRHLAGVDPVLGELFERIGPCPWLEYRMEPFDALVWAIVGQQISTRAAASITTRLRRIAGDPFEPQPLARATADTLRAAGLSRAKVRTVQNLARCVISAELDLPALAHAPDETVMATLCALPGIGPWTAQMCLIFGLQRPDVFSAGDLGLRKAIAIAYRHSETPSAAEAAHIAERWAPYRTVASWYLWRLVD